MKADILSLFAWLNLIGGGLVAYFFFNVSRESFFTDGGSLIVAVAVLVASFLQFALLGGLGEIVRRLVSIDETLKGANKKPADEGEPLTPKQRVEVIFGRDSRH